MTRRRWIADHWDQTTATLTGDQAAHLAHVLRAQPGMRFDVVAGDCVWHAEIASASYDAVRFTLLEQLDTTSALPLTLLLAVFKFDRMEWAIEKATELGVARIVPVVARRTEKHLAQAAVARVERWRRIAQEAAKQSRRSDVPAIDAPVPLSTGASLLGASLLGASLLPDPLRDPLRLLLSESERENGLREALERSGEKHIALAVGPEGGWTAEEDALFAGAGWSAVTLGPRVLRAETAAISAAAVVAAWVG